jgi:hypothetical protein
MVLAAPRCRVQTGGYLIGMYTVTVLPHDAHTHTVASRHTLTPCFVNFVDAWRAWSHCFEVYEQAGAADEDERGDDGSHQQ